MATLLSHVSFSLILHKFYPQLQMWNFSIGNLFPLWYQNWCRPGLITTNPNQHFQGLVAPTLSRTTKFSLMAKFYAKIASTIAFPQLYICNIIFSIGLQDVGSQTPNVVFCNNLLTSELRDVICGMPTSQSYISATFRPQFFPRNIFRPLDLFVAAFTTAVDLHFYADRPNLSGSVISLATPVVDSSWTTRSTSEDPISIARFLQKLVKSENLCFVWIWSKNWSIRLWTPSIHQSSPPMHASTLSFNDSNKIQLLNQQLQRNLQIFMKTLKSLYNGYAAPINASI